MSEPTARPAAPAPRTDGKPADGKAGDGAAPVMGEGLSFDPRMLSEEQLATLQSLSVNLARAAMTAQSAVAEAALRNAERPLALTPDPLHVAPALTQVMGRLAAEPDK